MSFSRARPLLPSRLSSENSRAAESLGAEAPSLAGLTTDAGSTCARASSYLSNALTSNDASSMVKRETFVPLGTRKEKAQEYEADALISPNDCAVL